MSEYTFNADYASIESRELPQAKILARWIKGCLNPNKVIDLGCGPGIYVHELINVGVDAIGYELDPRAKDIPHVIHKSLLDVQDKSDVVISLEVAEHLEPIHSQAMVDKVYETLEPGGTLIWTAANVGQGGVDHINCRPKEYWIKKFTDKGMIHCNSLERNLKNTLVSTIRTKLHGWLYYNLIVMYKEDWADDPSTAGSLIGPQQKEK